MATEPEIQRAPVLYLDTSAVCRAFHRQLWEISRAVCDAACAVGTARPLRALDAIHLATFVLARRRLAGLEFLTADDRLQQAATSVL